ncbi:MAG: hypothetical protein ACP5PV_12715 [Methanothrix sp.]
MAIIDMQSRAIIFAVALAFFAFLSIANSQCHSEIEVQLSTGDPISLGGFKIYCNNQLMGKNTDSFGAATIPIDSKGYFQIVANKEINGILYSGSNSVQIDCGEKVSVGIPVFAQSGRSDGDDQPGRNERPGNGDDPRSDDDPESDGPWPWQ